MSCLYVCWSLQTFCWNGHVFLALSYYVERNAHFSKNRIVDFFLPKFEKCLFSKCNRPIPWCTPCLMMVQSILSVCLLVVANIHLTRTRFFGLILLCREKCLFSVKSHSWIFLSKFEKCLFSKCNLPIPWCTLYLMMVQSILSVCLSVVENIHLNRTRFFGLILLCREKCAFFEKWHSWFLFV